MRKQKEIAIEDSNIAFLGGADDIASRVAAAKTEKEWKGAGKRTGIEVWRIENFGVKKWKNAGSFYDGDSFIVLHTYKDKESNKLLYDVHFWIGNDSSQDEYATAAYKTVELDDLLGQLPVQHREVQGNESPLFLSYFPKMRIMKGGIDSAFNHVKPETYETRLLQIKGTVEGVRCTQVDLNIDSLNNGDVFILDAGLKIFQWNGGKAGAFEKRKATEVTAAINQERDGVPQVEVLGPNDDCEDFWKVFGGKQEVKSAREGGDDRKIQDFINELYRLSDQSGKMKLTKEDEGKLNSNLLDSKDVFIVNAGHTVFVWLGYDISKNERKEAMRWGQWFIDNNKLPKHTLIVRVIEGCTEPLGFVQAFDGYEKRVFKKRGRTFKGGSKSTGSSGEKEEEEKVPEGCLPATGYYVLDTLKRIGYGVLGFAVGCCLDEELYPEDAVKCGCFSTDKTPKEDICCCFAMRPSGLCTDIRGEKYCCLTTCNLFKSWCSKEKPEHIEIPEKYTCCLCMCNPDNKSPFCDCARGVGSAYKGTGYCIYSMFDGCYHGFAHKHIAVRHDGEQ